MISYGKENVPEFERLPPIMHALANSSEYANVFLENPALDPLFYTLAGVAFVGFMLAIFGFGNKKVMLTGFVLIGLGALSALVVVNVQRVAKTEIVNNMTANVQKKFDAEFKEKPVNPRQDFLSKPRPYTLVFKNGASAEYSMYFKEDGEPIVVDSSAAPSAKELSQKGTSTEEAETKATPSSAPSPSELEESAKK